MNDNEFLLGGALLCLIALLIFALVTFRDIEKKYVRFHGFIIDLAWILAGFGVVLFTIGLTI